MASSASRNWRSLRVAPSSDHSECAATERVPSGVMSGTHGAVDAGVVGVAGRVDLVDMQRPRRAPNRRIVLSDRAAVPVPVEDVLAHGAPL